MLPILLILVLGLGIGTTAVIKSDDAKPGEFLYPFDRGIETMRLAVSREARKAELHVQFAKERLAEERALAQTIDREQAALRIAASNTATSTDAVPGLTNAVEALEDAKEQLTKKGSAHAASEIDSVIQELYRLAEGMQIDKADVKVTNDGFEAEIKTSKAAKPSQTTVRLEIEREGATTTSETIETEGNVNIKKEDDGQRLEVESEDGAVRVETEVRSEGGSNASAQVNTQIESSNSQSVKIYKNSSSSSSSD